VSHRDHAFGDEDPGSSLRLSMTDATDTGERDAASAAWHPQSAQDGCVAAQGDRRS
jgi:hypothetical protein